MHPHTLYLIAYFLSQGDRSNSRHRRCRRGPGPSWTAMLNSLSVLSTSLQSTSERRPISLVVSPPIVPCGQSNAPHPPRMRQRKLSPPRTRNSQAAPALMPRKMSKPSNQRPRGRPAGQTHGGTVPHRPHGTWKDSRRNAACQVFNIAVPSPLPRRSVIQHRATKKPLFRKLPKEQYSATPLVKCSLLSQLFQHPQPSPHTVSADTQPHLVPSQASPACKPPVEKMLGDLQSIVSRRDTAEDVDDDSEASDPENAIQISESLANAKLAEIARNSRPIQQRRRPLPPISAQQPRSSSPSDAPPSVQPSILVPLSTADPPLEALPQSPKTVRRGIIERELSSSWRRMLLHHRSLGRPPRHTVAPAKSPFITPRTSAPADPLETVDLALGQVHVDEDAHRRWAATVCRHMWQDDYHSRGW